MLLPALLCLTAQAAVQTQQFTTADPQLPIDYEAARVIGSTLGIDANGDGQAEFTIDSRVNDAFLMFSHGESSFGSVFVLDSQFVYNASLGTVIGPDSQGFAWGSTTELGAVFSASRTTGTIGFFNGDGYAPLRFDLDGQTHYGYLSLNAAPAVNGGWVYGFAWEDTPGMGITISAVPEPGTVALLAAGAAGLWWKRRRNLPNR